MPYKYLPDVSIADIAFEASARTLEQLFVECAKATTNTMVRDMKAVKPKTKKQIKIEADTIENLLFNFLNEIVFYKDARQLLFSKFKIKIKENKKYALSASMSGEKLDMHKHDLVVDVKAVTMHLFEVRHEKGKWHARVVLDI